MAASPGPGPVAGARWLAAGMFALEALLCAGCTTFGSAEERIPTVVVRGTGATPPAMVVVLPGFIYDAEDLKDKGVADAIHRGWPEADVVLVGATYPYYRTGTLAPKLHEQVIRPAREQGYRDVWLAGGSMGGMGVLLYEWAHPGEVTGLVLMSPFLGSGSLLDEIRERGLANWDPGPLSPEMSLDNYQRQVWRMIQSWRHQPALAQRVWLACGTGDFLFSDMEVLAPELPPTQFLARPGGHDFEFWRAAAEEIFRAISSN